MGAVLLLLGLVYRTIGFVWTLILKNFYGSQRNKIPAIENSLLLEPAIALAAKIRAQKLKSVDVVRAYIDRIKLVNPVINAVVDERFEEALKEAQNADEYVETCGKSEEQLEQEKPFLGVPFTSKNAIGVAGMVMDAGVLAKYGARPKEDSVAAGNMRSAGAIPICITNVPEACMWNDASCKPYGRTSNPYDLTRIPGGSSGGEGALITSAGSVVGLGNDIGGSVRIPAYCCGVFGHKPTTKIVSNQGQFPSSYRTDLDKYNVTGPLCRYAVDLQPVYKVMAGANASKLKLGTPVDMKKLKIYYTDNYPSGGFFNSMTTEMKEPILKVVKYFEKAHGVQAQRVKFPISPNVFTSLWLTKIGSAKATKMESIITNGDQPLNLPLELLKWVFRLGEHTFHILWYLFIQTSCDFSSSEQVKKSDQLLEKLDEGLRQMLGDDGVLLIPPQPGLPYFHQELIFTFWNVSYTGIFNLLGYPVTQCPTGLSKKDGLPLGLQVVATHFNDHLTISVAEEIEKAFGGWKSPAPIKTV